MLDVNLIRDILINKSKIDKLNILEYLKDQFDSFNKNIEHFEEIIYFLVDCSILERNEEVKIEIFETLLKAAVFQDIEKINFHKLIDNWDNISEDCLCRCIDILSFTHKIQYLPTIEKYLSHPDPYVRESANYATQEILGYYEKRKET
jgi:uncharacterized protein (DUF111 family)